MAVAGMTLGLAFVLYLLPITIYLSGFLTLAAALPLSGVALYRARKRSDGDGVDLALIAFAVNVVVLLFAIPAGAVMAFTFGQTMTGSFFLDMAVAIALWCITLVLAILGSRR